MNRLLPPTNATDHTLWFQKQVNTGNEFFIPRGEYFISKPIVFPAGCRIHGESVCCTTIHATNGNDIFRTQQAQYMIDNGQAPPSFDEGVMIENLTLMMGKDDVTSNGITMCQPGEAHCLRNLRTFYGGSGIKCIGVGTPGLRLQNATMVDHGVASIHITGGPGNALHWGGPTILRDISSDSRRVLGTSLLWLDGVATTVRVDGCKAEGQFDSLVRYDRCPFETFEGTAVPNPDNMAALYLDTPTWNCSTPGGGKLVKISGGPVSVDARGLNLYAVPTFVRDEYHNLTVPVPSNANGMMQVIRQISYSPGKAPATEIPEIPVPVPVA